MCSSLDSAIPVHSVEIKAISPCVAPLLMPQHLLLLLLPCAVETHIGQPELSLSNDVGPN